MQLWMDSTCDKTCSVNSGRYQLSAEANTNIEDWRSPGWQFVIVWVWAETQHNEHFKQYPLCRYFLPLTPLPRPSLQHSVHSGQRHQGPCPSPHMVQNSLSRQEKRSGAKKNRATSCIQVWYFDRIFLSRWHLACSDSVSVARASGITWSTSLGMSPSEIQWFYLKDTRICQLLSP